MNSTIKLFKIVSLTILFSFGVMSTGSGECKKERSYYSENAPIPLLKKVIKFNLCCGFHIECTTGGTRFTCEGWICEPKNQQ